MVLVEHPMDHPIVNALVMSVQEVLDRASLDPRVKLSLNFDFDFHVVNHELDFVFVLSLNATMDDVDLNLKSIKMLWNDLLLMLYSPDVDDVNSINLMVNYQLVVAVMMNLVPSMNQLVNLISKMMNSVEMKLVVNSVYVKMDDLVVKVLEMVASIQDADESMNFVVVVNSVVDDAKNYCYYSDYLDLVLNVPMHQLDSQMVDILLVNQNMIAVA